MKSILLTLAAATTIALGSMALPETAEAQRRGRGDRDWDGRRWDGDGRDWGRRGTWGRSGTWGRGSSWGWGGRGWNDGFYIGYNPGWNYGYRSYYYPRYYGYSNPYYSYSYPYYGYNYGYSYPYYRSAYGYPYGGGVGFSIRF